MSTAFRSKRPKQEPSLVNIRILLLAAVCLTVVGTLAWSLLRAQPANYAPLIAVRSSAPHTPNAQPSFEATMQRGGSFLCTDEYCTRYMVGTRGKGEVGSASNHLGFRCVKDAPQRVEQN